MVQYRRITLDMTPDGKFRRAPRLPLGTRILIAAIIVALIVGGLTLGALLVGLALALIPVVLIAIGVAYAAFRFERWRARRSVGGQHDIYRS